MITQDQVAEKLLWPLWRCVDDSYKDRYKRDIWEQFENAVRSAAYTGQLKTYLSNFKSRIPVVYEQQYIKTINSVIELGQDELILDWLRDETTYLVMLVRLKNQDKRDAWREANTATDEEIEAADRAIDELLNN